MKQTLVVTYRTETGRYGQLQQEANFDIATAPGMGQWLLENLPPNTTLSSWTIRQSPWTPDEIVLMRTSSKESLTA